MSFVITHLKTYVFIVNSILTSSTISDISMTLIDIDLVLVVSKHLQVMFARQLLSRGRVSVRPQFVAARVAPIGAVRHFSGNPMDMIQAQLAEATAKLQEIAKEPQQMIQPHLVSCMS